MKSMKTAGILFGVLLVLGGIATWDEWQAERDEKEKDATNRLLSIDVKDIVGIRYDKQAEDEAKVSLRLTKTDDRWRLVEPVDAVADNAAIGNWLKSFGDYNYDRIVADSDGSYDKYGVGKAAERTIVFETASGQTETVLVGDESAVGYKAYGRTSSTEGVFVGSRHLRIFTNKTVFDFRDKQVVDFDVADLTSFTFEQRAQPTLRLEKRSEGWYLKQPIEEAADGDEVEEFAASMVELRAAAFYDLPNDDLKLLFGDPDYRVTMEDSLGRQTSMLISNHGGKLVGAFDPEELAFELPDNMRATLNRKLLDFRMRRVIPVDANEVVQVDVDGELYKRIDGKWYMSNIADKMDDGGRYSGVGEAPESSHLQALVVDMEFAKTDDFYDLEGPEAKSLAEAPQHRILLRDKHGEEVTVELFADQEDQLRYWVKISGAKHLYRIHSKEFDGMKPLDAGSLEHADKGEEEATW